MLLIFILKGWNILRLQASSNAWIYVFVLFFQKKAQYSRLSGISVFAWKQSEGLQFQQKGGNQSNKDE